MPSAMVRAAWPGSLASKHQPCPGGAPNIRPRSPARRTDRVFWRTGRYKGRRQEREFPVTAILHDLPAHTVRFSRRARRISLRVVPGKGLEVVLPCNADPACVPGVLARHRGWIEKHLKRVPVPAGGGVHLPERLLLKGGSEEVLVMRPAGTAGADVPDSGSHGSPGNAGSPGRPGGNAASPAPAAPLTLRLPYPAPPARKLTLPAGSLERQFRYLREWVREEARVWLGGMLAEIAREQGFAYASLSIRFQKSRWGSCSAKGAINLNACLLFLPERLARYIILHELCHTAQMNHSPAFWKLVFAADPAALAKDRAMRGAWKYVPAWVHGAV